VTQVEEATEPSVDGCCMPCGGSSCIKTSSKPRQLNTSPRLAGSLIICWAEVSHSRILPFTSSRVRRYQAITC
jgi:hypothetical protein